MNKPNPFELNAISNAMPQSRATTARPGQKLVRSKPSPLALEQRFMFDGAAVDAAADIAKPVADSLLHFVAADTALPTAVITARTEAEKLVTDYLAKPDAQAQLFALFNGGQSAPSAAWQAAFDQLMADLKTGSDAVRVELRSSAELQGAKGAFSATGTTGQYTIYLNSDWLAGNPSADIGGADSASVTTVLVEELGHYLDSVLNQGGDTSGDEGEMFSRCVLNGTAPLSVSLVNTMDDHGTLAIDGKSVEAEFASFNFVTAYQIVVDVNNSTLISPPGLDSRQLDTASTVAPDQTYEYAIDKESNNHNFIYTPNGLGQVTVKDDVNSVYFSGNDVSAIGLNIGGTPYFGWISRPIKVGGQVVGFYFWTDIGGTIAGKAAFTNLAVAQADGNQDGDSSTLDNRAFVLVVNKAYFDNTLGFVSKPGEVTANTYKVIGSSSDRVDSALNALIVSNTAPVANPDASDTAFAPGAAGGPALEEGADLNSPTLNTQTSVGSGLLTATVDASGNVILNGAGGDTADTDANGDTITVSTIASSTGNSATVASTGTTNIVGAYGTLTIAANGAYTYDVSNTNSTVNALNVNSTPLGDVFTYTISDGNGGTATTTLTIRIKGSNDAPLAYADYNIAKESTTLAVSGFNYTGYSASGNVLPNDTDVDNTYQTQSSNTGLPSGDFSIVGASVTGSVASSSVAVTAGTYTLSFTLSNGFNSVAAGQEIFVHLGVKATPATGDVYTGLYTYNSGTGAYTLITVFSKTASTVVFDATPQYYWDTVTSTFKSVGSLKTFFTDNPNLTFQNTTDATPTVGETYTQTNGDKYAQTSAVVGSGFTTITGLSTQVGTITTGMTVSGTGVPTGTTVTNIGVTNGVITSITLSSDQITSPNGTVFSFTGNTGVAQTLQGAHGTLVLNANGSYTYTPTTDNSRLSQGQSAVEVFNYTMQDSQLAQSSSKLYITVYGTGTNDPVANNDAADGTNGTTAAVEQGFNTNTNTQISAAVNGVGNVLTNDLEKFGAATKGSDYVTLASNGDGSGSLGVTVGGTDIIGIYGTLTIKADGSYSYAVKNDNTTVDALLPGASLTETFRYTVANTLSPAGTASARLTITINGANDAPVAVNDNGGTLIEDVTTTKTGFVLINDTDVDANDTQKVTKAGTSSADLTVTPSSTSISNGRVVDGTYGQLVIGANGSYTYTLGVTPGQITAVQALLTTDHPTETFTYELTDTNGATDTATLTFTVDGSNEPPINTLPTSITLAMNTPLALTSGNAISVADADNNLSWVVLNVEHGTLDFTSAPSSVALTGDGTGTVRIAGTRDEINAALALLRYTPTINYAGFDYLTIMSQDAQNANDSDSIEIRIENNADSDGDGIADSTDIDDDNDGIVDILETQPDFKWAPISSANISGNVLTSSISGTGFTYTSYTDSGKGTKNALVTETAMPTFSTYADGFSSFGYTLSDDVIKNTAAGYNEIVFADPIYNPTLVFGSIGTPSSPVTINFGTSVEVLYYAGGTGSSYTAGSIVNTVTGYEGFLIVRLNGYVSNFNFTYVSAENWVGFGFGADVRKDVDSDSDGVVNRLDIDSDNDGITDNVEAQSTAGYIAPSATWTDADQDGLDDAYDANKISTTVAASIGLTPVDTDSDGTKDYLDANSDGDSLNDIQERYDGSAKSLTSTTDTDGDGLLDIFEGINANDDYLVNDGNYALGKFLLARVSTVNADGSNATPLSADMLYRSTTVPTITIGDATTEEGSNAVFTVNLNYVSQESIDVAFSTSVVDPLTAETEDIDPANLIVSYLSGGSPIPISPVSGKYTIPAGVTTLTVKVPTTSDDVYEGAETFTLAAAVTETYVTDSDIGTGTIKDDGTAVDGDDTALSGLETSDDDRSITVSGLDDVSEGSNAVFTVVLNGDVDNTRDTEIALSWANGQGSNSATVSGDYVVTYDNTGADPTKAAVYYYNGLTQVFLSVSSGKIVLPTGVTTFYVRVPTTQDTTLEGKEDFQLTAAVTGGKSAADTSTIVDDGSGKVYDDKGVIDPAGTPDDDRTLTVTGKDNVSEGSNAVFTVVLNGDVDNTRDTEIALSWANGQGSNSATVSGDYVVTYDNTGADPTKAAVYYYNGLTQVFLSVSSGKIVLPTGVTTFYVRVPTTQDTTLEGKEDFQLTAAVTGGKSAADTSTIVDDGSGKVYDDKGVIDPAGTPDDDRTLTVTGKDNVSEGSNAIFTVDLGGASANATEITLSLGAGGDTAVAADYGTMAAYYYVGATKTDIPITAGKISLPAGVTSFFVSVATNSDSPKVLEGAENFTLTAGITGGASANDTATILDDGTGKVYDDKGVIDPTGTPDDDRTPPAAPPPPAPVIAPEVPPEPAPEPAPTPAAPAPEFNSATVVTEPSPLPIPEKAAPIGELLTSASGFQITVSEAPTPGLTVFRGITDQFIEGNKPATFALPADAFVHTKADAVISIVAKLANGEDLPAWVQFDARSGTFKLDPPAGFNEELQIKVIARDSEGREASAIFKFSVGKGIVNTSSRSSLSEQIRLAAKRSTPWLDLVQAPSYKAGTAKVLPVRDHAVVRQAQARG